MVINERFSINYASVINGFQYNKGYFLNPKIWVQDRYTNATTSYRAILNPLSFTNRYF